MVQVRRRHGNFPVSTGKDYEHDQPTAMAHIGKFGANKCESQRLFTEYASDFTVDEGERMLRVMYADQADEIVRGGWKVIKQGP